MPVAFQDWTFQNAVDAVTLDAKLLAELKERRDYYLGQHWRDGDGWIGPWPTVAEGATRAESMGIAQLQLEIKRGFTPRNAIKEVTDRHSGGVCGVEPRWTFTADGIAVLLPGRRAPRVAAPAKPPELTPEQQQAERERETNRVQKQAQIERVNALVTKWWDARGAAQTMIELARVLLRASVATVRVFIPPSALDDETVGGKPTGRKQLRVTSIEDALNKIHVEVYDAEVGRVVNDPTSLADVGIKLAQRGGTKADPSSERTVAELTYLDDQRRTVLETIDGDNKASVSFDLGGNLLMFTVTRAMFLTSEAIAAQKALNFANTMIPRNVATSGFLEEVITNARVPGHWEEKDGRRQYIPDPIVRGPGAMNVWQGHELEDANGNKSMTTPGVHWRDPSDPSSTIKAKREHYSDVLEECQQAHALIAGDAVASGVSRQQARADFLSSLRLTQAPIERAGRWLIETVARLADALSSADLKSTATAGLRPVFSCYLDTGPLSPEERVANRDDATSGLLSVSTAIERGGIVDVDAELDRIRNEAGDQLDIETKRAAVYKAWIDAGIGEAAAARRAGLTPEEAALLVAAPQDNPSPVQQ